jgi:hypothetical protein
VGEVLAGVGGLDEEILALISLREQVDAALVDKVGTFDAGEGYKDDGAFSFATWLRARADITASDAGALARLARSLGSMAATEEAVAAGKVSVAKARLLARVVNDRTRARFDEDEAFLVDTVQGLDLDNTKIFLAQWARRADTDGPDPGDPDRNRALLTSGWNGRFHLDGDFDHVSGATINAVLQAIVDRMHQDGRFNDLGPHNTAGRRLADAVVEMAHRASGRNPDQPAIHPDIVIVVPYHPLSEEPGCGPADGPSPQPAGEQPDPFTGEPNPRPPDGHPEPDIAEPDSPIGAQPNPFGGPAAEVSSLAEAPELLGVGPLTWADLLRVADTATIAALHLDEHGNPNRLSRKHRVDGSLADAIHAAVTDRRPGQPLDLGREQRLANTPQWTVLRWRDRGCVVPGCHRPATWCSAHHLQWWDRDHGPTDLTNLCLVCSHCHHLIHDHGWTIHHDDERTWHLTRPDGTRVEPTRYLGQPGPRSRPTA